VQAWEQLAPRYLGSGSREEAEQLRQRARDEATQATREIITAAERQAAELLAQAHSERQQILSQARTEIADTRQAASAEAHDEAAKVIGAAEQRAAEIIARAKRDRDDILAEDPFLAGDPPVVCSGVAMDGYCVTCGCEMPYGRDHVSFNLGMLYGVTDRGLQRPRNEDAMALAIGESKSRPVAIAVVCDGVASSPRPDDASLACAQAAIRELATAARSGYSEPADASRAAVQAASAALRDLATPAGAPAATIVTAYVTGAEATICWLGNSRAYWLAETGSELLTTDDPLAADMTSSEQSGKAQAMETPQAHVITPWLAAGMAEPPHEQIIQFTPPGPGALLICTHGLWNYQPSPDGLAPLAFPRAMADAAAAADALVKFALESGGMDNITIVLIPFPLRQENEGLRQQLAEAERRAEAAQSQAHDHEASIRQFQRQVEGLRQRLAAAEAQAARADTEAEQLRQQLTAAKPLSRDRWTRQAAWLSRLGAGLIDIPPVPYGDPAGAVLADPKVPENRRYCASCDQPVGRGEDGRPGLTEGFCRHCGTPFSFSPKLESGELVAGQYEVLGCLAHGGLGWIYLAKDRNVSDRWVVLKGGLLDTANADARVAAVAERRFLAEVEHPSIVRIYNFVQHAARATGELADYIVMEYVGGKSLKRIIQDARNAGDSVPLAHALAYAIEVLPALGYLHDRGLVYCDFKPDNVIQTEERLKLIDLGAVRRIDSDEVIYRTVGYQAPEIETGGPSPSSDLYTVGRALAVMTFEFKGFQGPFKYSLPDGVPLLEQQESFARLLRRTTHTDPDRRFGSAAEMAEQLTGVLREVLATADGVPRPAVSSLFSPEVQTIGTRPDLAPDTPATPRRRGRSGHSRAALIAPPRAAEIIGGLPLPQVDRTDPAASYLATFVGLGPARRVDALTLAVSGDPTVLPQVTESPETRLALARARIDAGDYDEAAGVLADLAAEDPYDWRITWYYGLRDLATGRPEAAGGAFSTVFDELPGELAPKLALAFAAEAAGDMAAAGHYFRLVWTVDRSSISAALGVARTCLAAGDRVGALAALAAVPTTFPTRN
jgi:serine/threonine-protein kinase PknG